MLEHRPKISIVTGTYNSERYLPYLFQSILSQEGIPLKSIEIIFIDGGSTDRTLGLLIDFAERYKETFFDVIVLKHNRNYGISRARNDGITSSKGEYILILDSDIVLPPDGLKRMLAFLENCKDPRVVGVKSLHVFEADLKLHHKFTIAKAHICKYVNRITEYYSIADATLLKRDVFEKVGLYREDMGPPFSSGEDLELGMRIKRTGYKMYILGDLISIHKPLQASSMVELKEFSSLPTQIKKMIREYFSTRKGEELLKVVNAMPFIDKLYVLLNILTLDTAVVMLFIGFALLKPQLVFLGIALPLSLLLIHTIYAAVTFKCKFFQRIISANFIFVSRKLRYMVLEGYYLFSFLTKLFNFMKKLNHNR